MKDLGVPYEKASPCNPSPCCDAPKGDQYPEIYLSGEHARLFGIGEMDAGSSYRAEIVFRVRRKEESEVNDNGKLTKHVSGSIAIEQMSDVEVDEDEGPMKKVMTRAVHGSESK